MTYLVDTNVLARLANKSDLQHGVALHAVIELHRRGEILHLTPQVLVEFRSVATRPLLRMA
jgi:predicted nucleic acid-binding protein